MRPTVLAMLGMTCCLSIGCLGSSSPKTTEDAPKTADAPLANGSDVTEVKSAAAPKTASVEVVSWSEFQEWVAKQQGKVVVVDVWSTSCAECVEEFPHFVELNGRLGDRMVCASISIDYYGAGSPEELKPSVLEFLTEKNATSSNFLSSTPDEEVMDALDVASIPAVLVYDQSGALKKTFKNDDGEYGPGGFNYKEHINPYVEELLKPAD
jgi:thiol-disulfide isomerase/thioredoxin